MADSMGIPFIRMGDVVRDHYESSDKKMGVGEFAGSEREKHGFNIWAKRSLERMSQDRPVHLVDGCRSMKEIEAFRELADVSIIAIHTSPSVRYERLVSRGRSDAPKNMDEFVERDEREISWGIAEAIVLSDMMIINQSTLENFHTECKRTLEGLR